MYEEGDEIHIKKNKYIKDSNIVSVRYREKECVREIRRERGIDVRDRKVYDGGFEDERQEYRGREIKE